MNVIGDLRINDVSVDLSTKADKTDLDNYTTTTDINATLSNKADKTDPVFNISDFGDNKSLNDIIQQYAPTGGLPDLDHPILMDLKTFWDYRSGFNYGLANNYPYKISGINIYTDTEIQSSATKLDDSLYYFERHEDILSDDAGFDLKWLKTNVDNSIYYRSKLYRVLY